MIKPSPIIHPVVEKNGWVTRPWTLWLQNLVTLLQSKFITEGDVEIVGDTKWVILESPNGTRWRVQVSNAGALTVTSL